MKFLKRLLIGLASIIVILVVISAFLPKVVYVSRSTVIAAPAEAVFAYVNSPKKFNEWSPWAVRDPDTAYDFSGPEAGTGAKMSWSSDNPNVGSGTQEIVESRPGEFVEVALDFGGQGTGVARYSLAPADGGTEVTWAFETDLGYNPVARYMGLMFESWVGQDYETGLASLKALVEKKEVATDPSAE